MSNMEMELSSSSSSENCTNKDTIENAMDVDVEPSPGNSDEATLRIVDESNHDTLRQFEVVSTMSIPSFEEQLNHDEMLITENIYTTGFTESVLDGFDISEISNTNMAPIVNDMSCSIADYQAGGSDLYEDKTNLQKVYFLREELVPSLDLYRSNNQIPSEPSPDSDSDAFVSQVSAPCSILPQEMNIISPTMILSITESSNCFSTFFPENSLMGTNQCTVQAHENIEQSTRNNVSTNTSDICYLPSTHDHDFEIIDPLNTSQQTGDEINETFFIDQILKRIDENQPQVKTTEILSSNMTNVYSDSDTTSAEVNPNDFGLDSPRFESRCLMDGDQTVNLRLFPFPSMDCNNSAPEFLETDDTNRDINSVVNLLSSTDLSQNKYRFSNQNIKDDFSNMDSTKVIFKNEDLMENRETGKTVDFPEIINYEQNCTNIANIEMVNNSLANDSSNEAFGSKFRTHDDMFGIVKELRCMSDRIDFETDNFEFLLHDEPECYSSDSFITRTNYKTPVLYIEHNHRPLTRQFNETIELSTQNSSNLKSETSGNQHETFSVDSNVRAKETHARSEGTTVVVNPDNNENILTSQSRIGSYDISSRIKPLQTTFTEDEKCVSREKESPSIIEPLQTVLIECENFVSSEKENIMRGTFVGATINKNTTLADYRIHKASQEKPENVQPKRVSFCTNDSIRERDNAFDIEMLSDDSDVNDLEYESPAARRLTFNIGLRFNDAGREYSRPHSDDMKSQRLSEIFRRTVSLPGESESYFPYRRAGTGSNDSIHLDLSVFKTNESKEQTSSTDKLRSQDDQFDAVSKGFESLDGATNLAFLLESPVTQCSQEYDNDGDVDEKEGVFKYFLPKIKEIQYKNGKLCESGRAYRPIRKHSATELGEIAMKKHNKHLNVWYSLDESTSESPFLTNVNTRVKKHYNEHVSSSKIKVIVQEGKKDINISAVSSDDATEPPVDEVQDEDTLSLEFFVPGKKKYIRLHRRTFIHFVLKYLIFLFTFLFWVASVTGIAFGAWMLTSNTAVIDDVSDLFLDPYVLICVVSGIIFLVAFFGCIGALRENICLLQLFHISVTAVLVLEVVLGTLVFLFYTMPEFRMMVKVGPEEVMKKAVKEYFDNEVLRNWIDMIQKEFQCCGVSMSDHGYLDWQENVYYNCSPSNPSVYRCSVPLSCCIFMPGDYINYMCGAGITKTEEFDIIHIINTKGCMKSFGEWLGRNDEIIGCVALGVIIPQFLGVIAARYFIKNLRIRRTTWLQRSDRLQIVTPT